MAPISKKNVFFSDAAYNNEFYNIKYIASEGFSYRHKDLPKFTQIHGDRHETQMNQLRTDLDH